jgi:hypothetical protein
MAADQFADALQNVRRDLGRRLRVSRATIEGVEAGATLAAN